MFAFTAEELVFLRDTRAITTDEKRRAVLVGLTFEETGTYMTHRRQFLTGERDRESRKACIALGKKHQQARLEVLGTEIFVRTNNPPRH